MKFLCGNCKAKYQIADEKIAGRTLRMKCRRCTHDIIIKGDSLQPAAPAPAAPRKTSSSSHLGADFRRQVAAAPPPPPPPEPLDQWHVAINDVPVGPIRKAEIQRKIGAGAVNGDSLCWREGFDDWRPIKEVPELTSLLRQPPPPPPKPAAVGRGIQRRREGSRPRVRVGSSRAPSSSPHAATPPAPAVASSGPGTGRSNVVPIGGRLGAAAAPALDDELDLMPEEPTRVSEPLFPEPAEPKHAATGASAPTPAPEPILSALPDPFAESARPAAPTRPADVLGAAPPAPMAATSDPFFTAAGSSPSTTSGSVADFRPARRLPVGAWIAIAGAVAFGMTMAVMLGVKFLFAAPEVAVNEPVAPVDPTPQVPELVAPDDEPLIEPEEEITGDLPSEESPRSPSSRRSPSTTMQTSTQQPSQMLSAEDLERMRRFGGGGGATPMNINLGSSGGGGDSRPSGPGLNADQLNRVVTNNRPSLRRCYETAIRGMREAPTVRVNVSLTVGTSGRVTRVNATATTQLPGLTTCVQSAVRTWVFPSAGNTTVTTFPLVFTGAG